MDMIKKYKETQEQLKKIEKNYPSFFKNEKLNIPLLFNFLKDNNFLIDSKDLKIYKQDNNILKEVSKSDIVFFIKEHITTFKDNISKIQKSLLSVNIIDKHFSESKLILGLNNLDESNLLKPNKKIERFFFKNCFVEVTKDNISVKKYSELKKQVKYCNSMKRDFNQYYKKEEISSFEFNDFLTKISMNENKQEDQERYKALNSIIGYLLSSYKYQSLTKAIQLTDMKLLTDQYAANGGTGKSLLLKSLSYLIETININGKKIDDKHKYSDVKKEHNLIVFDDVTKGFNIEILFSDITSDMTINHKYGKLETIPFKDAPKIAITTNTPINLNTDSAERRLVTFEISDYFNQINTPIKRYKREFFTTWKTKDFDKFYSLMFQAVKVYLNSNLIEPPQINLKKNMLISQTSLEFVEFMESFLSDHNNSIPKKEFNKQFYDYSGIQENRSNDTKIGIDLNKYCNAYNLKIVKSRPNGLRMIKIVEK